jgi:hypothetical protein
MKKSVVTLFCLVGLAMSHMASADTFNLTSDHCTGGCGTPPFGTVTLTQVGANVNVVVSLINGNTFVETGAGAGMNFLFDDSAIALANITSIVSATGQPMSASGGPLHADGTGDWMWGVFCTTCGNGGAGKFAGPISFTVTGTTLAQMEVGHPVAGFGTELFVVDMLSGTTGNTGPVDVNTPPVTVPDGGSTATLLGTVLLGLGMLRRRFAKN